MKPRMRLNATLTGFPQWIRLPWLNGLYFPFWRTVNAFKRGAIAMRGHVNLVTDDELATLTEPLEEHPEGWEHPCNCALCRSYAD